MPCLSNKNLVRDPLILDQVSLILVNTKSLASILKTIIKILSNLNHYIEGFPNSNMDFKLIFILLLILIIANNTNWQRPNPKFLNTGLAFQIKAAQKR